MSAKVLRHPELMKVAAQTVPLATNFVREAGGWRPENFAREQIRGLVRQVFFSSASRPVRQIVLSAIDQGTDIGSICRRVGTSLASDTRGNVAVVVGGSSVLQEVATGRNESQIPHGEETDTPLRRLATRVSPNLWFVPDLRESSDKNDPYSFLRDLRREFEYSIVQGPIAGESGEASTLGQLADGIILVLVAGRTRRAAARKAKETLEAAHAHFLGTILSGRTFPVPEAIYRRL